MTPVGDGGMRLSTQATINRQDFGVDGNMMGMIGDDVTISGDIVFRQRGLAVRSGAWSSHRPLRVLVYSDNPRTREQVQLALGKRVHPDYRS